MRRDSEVGIATCYGLDIPGIESLWGARFSAPVQNRSGAQPASYTMGPGLFPGVKRPVRGVDHPSSVEVKDRIVIPLISLCAFMACYTVKFTLLRLCGRLRPWNN